MPTMMMSPIWPPIQDAPPPLHLAAVLPTTLPTNPYGNRLVLSVDCLWMWMWMCVDVQKHVGEVLGGGFQGHMGIACTHSAHVIIHLTCILHVMHLVWCCPLTPRMHLPPPHQQGVLPTNPDAWLWVGDMTYLDTALVDCEHHPQHAGCHCEQDFLHHPWQCFAGDVQHAAAKWQAMVWRVWVDGWVVGRVIWVWVGGELLVVGPKHIGSILYG